MPQPPHFTYRIGKPPPPILWQGKSLDWFPIGQQMVQTPNCNTSDGGVTPRHSEDLPISRVTARHLSKPKPFPWLPNILEA